MNKEKLQTEDGMHFVYSKVIISEECYNTQKRIEPPRKEKKQRKEFTCTIEFSQRDHWYDVVQMW